MARYIGPKDKINRRFGVALFGPSKALERRNFPPGQHGFRAGRKKKSDYSIALGEKQKLRFQYGVLEKQFRGYYAEAARRRAVTGDTLCQLLETRLDNVCYRLGYGNTRSAARQLVNHGHILVNGVKTDVASSLSTLLRQFLLKSGSHLIERIWKVQWLVFLKMRTWITV